MYNPLRISLLLSFLIIAFVNFSYATTSLVKVKENLTTLEDKSTLLKDQITIDDVLNKDRKRIEKKLGKKLSFKERMTLRLIQKKFKKKYRKGASKEDLGMQLSQDHTSFHVGAFFLGFLLGLIGVGIAYIFMPSYEAKSAWIGLAVVVAILLARTL